MKLDDTYIVDNILNHVFYVSFKFVSFVLSLF